MILIIFMLFLPTSLYNPKSNRVSSHYLLSLSRARVIEMCDSSRTVVESASQQLCQQVLTLYLFPTVYGQDPTVKIVETTPTAIDSVLIIKRDRDVTISCAVDNLQLGLQVGLFVHFITYVVMSAFL